jgi:dephospho-CoA kinase
MMLTIKQMPNKIIGLVGMCGSGKSVVTDFFKEKGYGSVYFGGATMDELKKRGMEVNEANEKLVREDLRKTLGMGAFAIVKMPEIEAALAEGNVIVDGLYSWSEYKVLKEKFGENFEVLAVFTPRKVRYQRLAERKVRPLTAEEAFGRDQAEIEHSEKGGPIAMADHLVSNDGSMEDLNTQLAELNL